MPDIDPPTLLIYGIIGFIVLYITIQIGLEVTAEFEHAKTTCHAHNGTVVFEDEIMQCEYPNGTVKPVK